MKSKKILINSSLAAGLLFLSGCGAAEDPNQIYLDYNNRVIQGLPFVEETIFFTERKLAEIKSSFPRYMVQMKKSEEEVIKFYSSFSQSVAKCKEITLADKIQTESSATLTYTQRDICGNGNGGMEKQVVSMIKENGWKIDSVEISL